MNTVSLYTLPQWFVFASLFVVIYGWIEQKKTFRLLGLSLFLLLGAFSLYVLQSDLLAAGAFLSPEQMAAEKLNGEIIDEIPIQAKLFSAYLTFLGASILAIPALVFDWLDKKHSKLFIILCVLMALLGFFIVAGAVRSV